MEKTRFDIQETTVNHLEILALEMRAQDIREIESCSEVGILPTLEYFFELSEQVKTVFMDGVLVGVYGFVLSQKNGCSVWFLGTENINNCSLSFVRESRKVLKNLLQKYGCVFSLVSIENKTSMKWLKWLGFTVSKEIQSLGSKSSPFYRVSIEGV